ncbi:ImmA/IrrE family metallo-endopeptidase [Herbiconiux sp. KACC 21604]|uniref:ImmA/IrrE family metallo-endopeptidase n=1 Tax=unclassified Herbiconiux TaxID=2618217 RepID=UPI001491D57C|nr:ImmA/IrrE family metallo-endopeptidase [Herbiconiux sp. SALV-R1]QJU54384.1 ImmA/IrrE family metallo-endopeptidase [Herbiconiux sp. SALV-R1]WPO85455.1 ImmA/IrrE family metallo-endopeptidase [Herbiconiux sp. KACC 21604]
MTLTFETEEDYEGTTAYMFGRDSYYDGPCARRYDPYVHAEDLGLPIIYRELPRDDIDACYSEEHHAIFVRPNLHGIVERCAIAHEIVHFEHGDVGDDRKQEDRADRISARRLVRPRDVYDSLEFTNDMERVALEIEVTEKVMAIFIREFANRA